MSTQSFRIKYECSEILARIELRIAERIATIVQARLNVELNETRDKRVARRKAREV